MTNTNIEYQKLIEKYNVPVPRYTSYPPANYFGAAFSAENYRQEIIRSNHVNPTTISFYFHIPYCRRLCHYCGCNAFPMVSDEQIKKYVEALHKEIDLVLPLLDKNRLISQIHYGGGTPTILEASVLQELNDHLLQNFPRIDRPEIAIECHPGWIGEKYWEDLCDMGFTRFSLGIQDFNNEVMKCINRKPSKMPVDQIVSLLREKGAKINMDFLYGLPLQTPESFCESIRKAICIRPDRLVTFSYAHVPWVNKRQLILEKTGLPLPEVKKSMFDLAQEALINGGYVQIGMDHFVQPDDELAIALSEGQLHRNFQGYCTLRTTGQVYAFGVTGISQLTYAYAQNEKDISQYIAKTEQGILPTCKGYLLSEQELVTRKAIDMLMCNYQIDWIKLSQLTGISVVEIKNILEYNEDRIRTLEDDGVIKVSDDRIVMTAEGRMFVRNVATVFDPLMKNNQKSFSKPI